MPLKRRHYNAIAWADKQQGRSARLPYAALIGRKI